MRRRPVPSPRSPSPSRRLVHTAAAIDAVYVVTTGGDEIAVYAVGELRIVFAEALARLSKQLGGFADLTSEQIERVRIGKHRLGPARGVVEAVDRLTEVPG